MEQKDNSGALFKNDKKGNANWPDYRGPCVVNGKEMEISAWLKVSKDGKTKFMSLSFGLPYKSKQVAGDDDTRQRKGAQSMGDDIDF